ncbi:MAG: ATP-binding protein [Nitrosopumilus sp.]|nr:ATP-binding protein [Nitrosopumilus sp.]MDH3517006.1 ATP-binding protein [Nitrosopumilus sp.]MDH3565704.1 ATP-binding protein [Nitrosopumilus sp.]MDH5416562.1 ATP-binding protein [Nitrosopumilus sp.]MDH5555162.1 ATP-binding protein [Nitrosopumilus sp.]
MDYVLMIGVALSGKTTYVKANFDHEEIRLYYFDNNRKKEMNYIEQCLKQGKSIVVDDTNLTLDIRKMHIDMAKKYNAKMIGIFMNTSIGLLHQRRMRRNEQFPLVAINRQLKDLETPTKDEGFDILVVKKDYEQPKNI